MIPRWTILLLVSGSAIILHSTLAQQQLVPFDHVIPGYLFDVYENDKLVSKKIHLSIDANKSLQTVTCRLVYILINEDDRSVSLESHCYTSTDGSISNTSIELKRISFDLSLTWLIPDRTIRVSCDCSASPWRYQVQAIGLWDNLGASGSTRVEWRIVDEIILPYSKVVIPFLQNVEGQK